MVFFLIDANGNRIAGPYDTQQLQELATQGRIAPHTLLESDTGHRGTAGQIPGFTFNTATPFTQAVQTEYSIPQTTGVPLNVKQRKGRIHFWTVLCTVMLLLYTLTGILSGVLMCAAPKIEKEVRKALQVQSQAQSQARGAWAPYISSASEKAIEVMVQERVQEIQGRIALTVLILIALTGIPYLCCYYYYLLRLWEEIPRELASTTPGNAAGFALIPIFHLFWLFTAFSGLYRDMNKTIEFHGLSFRFGLWWINLICVVWVLLFASGMTLDVALAVIPAEVMPVEQPVARGVLAVIFATLGAILTIPVYWDIRNDVHRFIDIKSNVGR